MKTKVKIKLSSSFLARTKCKFCNQTPNIHLCIELPGVSKQSENKYLFEIFKKSMLSNRCATIDELFSTVSQTSIRTDYKSYRPRLHRGYNYNNQTLLQILCCKCGRLWFFNQKMFESKPDVHQRKSLNSYPNTIID